MGREDFVWIEIHSVWKFIVCERDPFMGVSAAKVRTSLCEDSNERSNKSRKSEGTVVRSSRISGWESNFAAFRGGGQDTQLSGTLPLH